jgi:hypothetical protein
VAAGTKMPSLANVQTPEQLAEGVLSLAPGLGHGQTDSYSTVQLAGTATYGVIPLQA